MEQRMCGLPHQAFAGVVAVSFIFSVLIPSPGRAEAISLTLERAHELAEHNNPALKQAQFSIDAAQGEQQDAQALLYNNPTLFAEYAGRRGAGVSSREWIVGVEQPVELAGQPGIRKSAAYSELMSARLQAESLRHWLYAEVEKRFLRVLADQSRVTFGEESLALVERSADIVRSRVGAGEDTRLEGNLAEVEVASIRNQLDGAREQLLASRNELAVLLQLPSGLWPEAVGSLTAAPVLYTLQDLIGSGLERPWLAVLAYRENAQRSRLELARAARYPDLTVGLVRGRDGVGNSRDTMTGITLSLPLPLFNRNASGIGKAYADLSRTQVERAAAERDIRSDIQSLWKRLSILWGRLQRVTETVLPTLNENMHLSEVSYRAGEISISELLLATRQVVDTRRDILEVTVEYETTRVYLEEAAGLSRIAVSR